MQYTFKLIALLPHGHLFSYSQHRTGKYSMHACLLIPEIVKIIFNNIHIYDTDGSLVNFGDHSFQRVARRSLAALSRVCRSFKDIALDALWVKLDNLEPLFACLPRDLWAMTGDRKLVCTMYMPRL
jgi:hypothetical protein